MLVAMSPRVSGGVGALKSFPNGVSPSGRGWATSGGWVRHHRAFWNASAMAAGFCSCVPGDRSAQSTAAGAISSRERITTATRTPRIALR